MKLIPHNPPHLGEMPFHHGLEVREATRTLFLSGQLGLDADGNAPDSVEDQCRLVWENIGAVLASAGMDFANLVRLTVSISDVSVRPFSTAARLAALGAHKVAITTTVSELLDPAWRIEIDGVAMA